MATIKEIAEDINISKTPITLVFAFNSTGKTNLSVEYKNITKKEDNSHTGVYYNAYSEDLFRWDNDEDNDNQGMRLEIVRSSLNPYFSSILENPEILKEKLAPYLPKYSYEFVVNKNPEVGIDAVLFSRDGAENIKISRGEERIFIWCFFLALFEADTWTGDKDSHFFIDDPVSSMDDHNIFITANSLMSLIEDKIASKSERRRIIVTTHHVGLFSILSTRLMHNNTFKNNTRRCILRFREGNLELKNHDKDVFFYHLHLMQILNDAISTNSILGYHFLMLRQILEIISSFLGAGGIQKALYDIGFEEDLNMVSNQINTLTHKDGRLETVDLKPNDSGLLVDVFNRIQKKYNFIIH